RTASTTRPGSKRTHGQQLAMGERASATRLWADGDSQGKSIAAAPGDFMELPCSDHMATGGKQPAAWFCRLPSACHRLAYAVVVSIASISSSPHIRSIKAS